MTDRSPRPDPSSRGGRYRLATDRLAYLLIASLVVVAMIPAASALTTRWLPAKYLWLRAQGRVDARCTFALASAGATRLSRRQAIAAANRGDVRQVRSTGAATLYETARGEVWTSRRDSDPIATASTFHESQSIRWYVIDGSPAKPVQSGDVVLDAGAHVGESTYAALASGAALVVAIEPDGDNLAALRQNLRQPIDAGRVVVVEKGVYDRSGSLRFVHREGSRDGTFVEGAGGGDALPVTTIDAIVSELGLARVDFIKMDIEGSEVPALRGAVGTLRRFAPRIAVGTYHKAGDLAGIEHVVLSAQPRYVVHPSFCLDAYGGHEFGGLFPLMLFFSAETRGER